MSLRAHYINDLMSDAKNDFRMFLYSPDSKGISLLCLGTSTSAAEKRVPIRSKRNDVCTTTTSCDSTDPTANSRGEGNKIEDENMDKLTAKDCPIQRHRSSSDESYYSARNENNSIEEYITTSSKQEANKICYRCNSYQMQIESLDKEHTDHMTTIDTLKKEIHKKDCEIEALKKKSGRVTTGFKY